MKSLYGLGTYSSGIGEQRKIKGSRFASHLYRLV